jgi:iron(III) transport system substrate-binding protein
LIEAARKEGEVVVWVNMIYESDRIIKQIHEKYPFLEVKVWDTRASTLLVKLAEEAKVGKFTADFVQTTENDMQELIRLGIVQQFDWPATTERWTDQPDNDFYRVHETNLRVMTYNTDKIPRQEAPKTWDDLKDPKWKGRAIVSSSGDENPLGMAFVWGEAGKLNWEKSESFWAEVMQNVSPRVTRGYPMELIASGESELFISASSTTTQLLMDRGAPIDYAPISPVIAVNFAMGVLKSPPHPNAARLFVENISSPEGLLTWSEATRSLVFDEEVARQSRVHKVTKDRGIEYITLPAAIMTEENTLRSAEFWLRQLGLRG